MHGVYGKGCHLYHLGNQTWKGSLQGYSWPYSNIRRLWIRILGKVHSWMNSCLDTPCYFLHGVEKVRTDTRATILVEPTGGSHFSLVFEGTSSFPWVMPRNPMLKDMFGAQTNGCVSTCSEPPSFLTLALKHTLDKRHKGVVHLALSFWGTSPPGVPD